MSRWEFGLSSEGLGAMGRAEGGGSVCGMGKNDKAVMEALSEEVTFEQRPE